jgi:hypothetical protein
MKQYGFITGSNQEESLLPSCRGWVLLVRDGQANAIFQEGNIIPHEAPGGGSAAALPALPEVVDYMKETYGFSEAIIPMGRLKGVEEDLPP